MLSREGQTSASGLCDLQSDCIVFWMPFQVSLWLAPADRERQELLSSRT